MLTENTPENIKRLRKNWPDTEECAEIFSMSPRTWRRKEEPVGTASGTALTPVEFKYLLLLAGNILNTSLVKRSRNFKMKIELTYDEITEQAIKTITEFMA